jgi:hypothetical protein
MGDEGRLWGFITCEQQCSPMQDGSPKPMSGAQLVGRTEPGSSSDATKPWVSPRSGSWGLHD